MNKKVIGLIIVLGLIGSVAESKYEEYKYEQTRYEQETTEDYYEMEQDRIQSIMEHKSYTDSACRGRKQSKREHGYYCNCITCIG